MPVPLTYPGVYIEEIPSGVRTVVGVSTSTAAFVGAAPRGPVGEPVTLHSYADYERAFGGLAVSSTMSYAIRDFFLNGGSTAVAVRLAGSGAAAATLTADTLSLRAANVGTWGNPLKATVSAVAGSTTSFNMVVDDGAGTIERYLNLTVVETDPRYVGRVLDQSALVELTAVPSGVPDPGVYDATDNGANGAALAAADYTGSLAAKTGINALEKTDIFNLLCIPPPSRAGVTATAVWQAAAAYCLRRRAMLLIDPEPGWTKDNVDDNVALVTLPADQARNAAVYFPRLLQSDPLLDNATDSFVPCGAVAGVIARTDASRGVWKAPAGVDAGLAGIRGLSINLTDGENGDLNPLGINCLRSFPVIGSVVWGARTRRGADQLADEYKYLPVRRLVLFLEESLFRGTQWAVFEPNDEPLWSQLRLNIGAFMQNLFRQGAFQGRTPAEAFFVRCDKTTTTQNDINLGVVNVIVGFAPLKPAEFVVIKIQQMAGQVQA